MSNHGTFATVINCMDGRTQLPAINYLKDKYKVDYIDSITEAGPDGILAKNEDIVTITSIKNRLLVSTGKHGSTNLAIVGHYDCAGNPVSKEEHIVHLQKSKELINSWNIPNLNIILLWIDENWQVSEVN